MLNEQDIEGYHRDGQLVPDYTLPPETLAAMRAALDRLLADNPDHASDSMLCPHLVHDPAQDMLAVPLRGSAEWMAFAQIPEILDMVSQLIGDELILWGTTVFGKPARIGKETPWHQDAEYWPIRPSATCSVWIALDDATPDNGCLRVIPGSHMTRRLHDHHYVDSRDVTLRLEVDDGALEGADARDVSLCAGQISLHDVHLIHGSNANRSGRRRAGFVLRLMPATSLFDHALGRARAAAGKDRIDYGKRAIFLMRGRDRHGGNDFSIGHAEARAGP